VSSLLGNYLKDLEKRKAKTVGEDARHVEILRKGISLNEMTEVINV